MVKKCPYYLFDSNKFLQNINSLRDRLSDRVKICFSVKSNPFMVAYGAKYADCIEVCSEGEYELGVARTEPENIVAGGVYKSLEWLRLLARSNVSCISVESVLQLSQLEREAKIANSMKRVFLRLSSNNQFGMDEKDIIEILNHAATLP